MFIVKILDELGGKKIETAGDLLSTHDRKLKDIYEEITGMRTLESKRDLAAIWTFFAE